jgi:hypothetical protein
MGLLMLTEFVGRMQRNDRLRLCTTRVGPTRVAACWLGDGSDNVGDVALAHFRRARRAGLLREEEPESWGLSDRGRAWADGALNGAG